MKRAFLDTSVLVAIAFGEVGAERTRQRLGRFEAVFACGLLEAELRSALSREGIDPAEAESHLHEISFVEPPRRLTPEFSRALKSGHLRGADLWHLACALYLSPDPRELAFLTFDREQKMVARRLGFRSR